MKRPPRVCPACGITVTNRDARQVYCSRSCAARTRMRRRSAEIQTRTIKRCYGCRTELPIEAFAQNASQPDGHKPLCKVCSKAERAARYQMDKDNPKRTLAQIERNRVSYLNRVVRQTNATIEEWAHHRAMRGQRTAQARVSRNEQANIEQRRRYANDEAYRQEQRDKAHEAHQQRPWVSTRTAA
jgi:hypothetical protein